MLQKILGRQNLGLKNWMCWGGSNYAGVVQVHGRSSSAGIRWKHWRSQKPWVLIPYHFVLFNIFIFVSSLTNRDHCSGHFTQDKSCCEEGAFQSKIYISMSDVLQLFLLVSCWSLRYPLSSRAWQTWCWYQRSHCSPVSYQDQSQQITKFLKDGKVRRCSYLTNLLTNLPE